MDNLLIMSLEICLLAYRELSVSVHWPIKIDFQSGSKTSTKKLWSFILAVKRLMREAQELSESTSEYFAQPLADNLFEWHFTVRGPADSDFEGGVYHGRILLPPDYPMKPPNIIILTVRNKEL